MSVIAISSTCQKIRQVITLIREDSEGRVSGHCFGILSPTSWPRGNSTLAHVSRTATSNQDLHSGVMRRSTFDRTSKAAFLLTGNNSALSILGAPRSRENLTALALRVDYDGILIGRTEFLELKGVGVDITPVCGPGTSPGVVA